MFYPLLVLLITVPALEIYTFLLISDYLGLLNAVFILLTLSAIGGIVLRMEGIRLLTELRRTLSLGETPTSQLIEGVLLAVGGIMLLTPGFLTDAAALAALLPPSRRALGRWISARIERRLRPPPPPGGGPTIIDI